MKTDDNNFKARRRQRLCSAPRCLQVALGNLNVSIEIAASCPHCWRMKPTCMIDPEIWRLVGDSRAPDLASVPGTSVRVVVPSFRFSYFCIFLFLHVSYLGLYIFIFVDFCIVLFFEFCRFACLYFCIFQFSVFVSFYRSISICFYFSIVVF